MDLNMKITWDVETDDAEVDELLLDIAEQERLNNAAALADRLEDEGIHDARVKLG